MLPNALWIFKQNIFSSDTFPYTKSFAIQIKTHVDNTEKKVGKKN